MSLAMSALPTEADIRARLQHVCFGPEPEVVASFDHLVGARVSTCGRDDEVERLSNL
jgi:hypothetical protein